MSYTYSTPPAEYLEYLSIAQKIFSTEAIKEYNHLKPFFEVMGSHFFGNCDSILLQCDCEFLYIPQKIIEVCGMIRPAKTNTDMSAQTTSDLLSYYKPSTELFTEKCTTLLKQIKDMKNKIRLENLKYDF